MPVKRAVKRVAGRALRLLRAGKQRDGIVFLCYHRIGALRDCLNMFMPREEFCAQMEFLQQEHRLLSFDRAMHDLEHGLQAGLSVAITFDDGFRDNALAFEDLGRRRVSAALFVTVNAIDRAESFWFEKVRWLVEKDESRFLATMGVDTIDDAMSKLKTLPPRERMSRIETISDGACLLPQNDVFSWSDLRRWRERGTVVGSHGMQHESLRHLDPAERRRELLESRRRLESELGKSVHWYAFPNGGPQDVPEGSELLVEEAGYSVGFSLQAGWTRESCPILPRICVTRDFALRGERFDRDLFAFNILRALRGEPADLVTSSFR